MKGNLIASVSVKVAIVLGVDKHGAVFAIEDSDEAVNIAQALAARARGLA